MVAAQNTPESSVEIFENNRLYGQPEFTAKGCGGKTRWWDHIKNGDFPIVEVGRHKKAMGRDLNALFNQKSK